MCVICILRLGGGGGMFPDNGESMMFFLEGVLCMNECFILDQDKNKI